MVLSVIPHTLSFIINDFCRNGYLLAYERGLTDLKGLVDADSVAAEDFEILESVNDPVINVLLESCERILKTMKTFYLINNLDELEVMMNDEFNEVASDCFYLYNFEEKEVSYDSIRDNLQAFYFSVTQAVYIAAWQIECDDVEVPDAIYERFIDDFLKFFDKVESKDKNISLLYELIYGLNQDFIKIDNLPLEQ